MQETRPPELASLHEGIAAVAAALPGRLGVLIRYLEQGLEARFSAEDLFPAASVIKLPIMVEVYRQAEEGILSLDERLPLIPEEATGGSGVLQYLHQGLDLTVADAVELMIVVSDNTATNLLLRRVGPEAVNGTMQELGLSCTRTAGPIRGPNARPGLMNMSRTTPAETAALLTWMARGELFGPAASAAMRTILERQMVDEMLPRYLPITSYPERDRPVPGITLAHKTGSLSGVRNDVGILSVETAAGRQSAVISAFAADVDDGNLWTVENVASRAVAEVGRLVYETLLRLAVV